MSSGGAGGAGLELLAHAPHDSHHAAVCCLKGPLAPQGTACERVCLQGHTTAQHAGTTSECAD
jgi:hypothetical protein